MFVDIDFVSGTHSPLEPEVLPDRDMEKPK